MARLPQVAKLAAVALYTLSYGGFAQAMPTIKDTSTALHSPISSSLEATLRLNPHTDDNAVPSSKLVSTSSQSSFGSPIEGSLGKRESQDELMPLIQTLQEINLLKRLNGEIEPSEHRILEGTPSRDDVLNNLKEVFQDAVVKDFEDVIHLYPQGTFAPADYNDIRQHIMDYTGQPVGEVLKDGDVVTQGHLDALHRAIKGVADSLYDKYLDPSYLLEAAADMKAQELLKFSEGMRSTCKNLDSVNKQDIEALNIDELLHKLGCLDKDAHIPVFLGPGELLFPNDNMDQWLTFWDKWAIGQRVDQLIRIGEATGSSLVKAIDREAIKQRLRIHVGEFAKQLLSLDAREGQHKAVQKALAAMDLEGDYLGPEWETSSKFGAKPLDTEGFFDQNSLNSPYPLGQWIRLETWEREDAAHKRETLRRFRKAFTLAKQPMPGLGPGPKSIFACDWGSLGYCIRTCGFVGWGSDNLCNARRIEDSEIGQHMARLRDTMRSMSGEEMASQLENGAYTFDSPKPVGRTIERLDLGI